MKIPRWMLPHTATVRVYGGEGRYEPTYEQGRSVKCRIEPMSRTIVRETGNEITTRTRMFLPAVDFNIPIQSQVDFDGETFTVIESGKMYGPRGEVHHIELLLY